MLHRNRDGSTHRVAVIGGGFAGASVARCLALKGGFAPGDIAVFEPREALGAGLAYDAPDPALRLNVSAHRMRALPDRPEAFVTFLTESRRLARDPDAIAGQDIYAARQDFAAFMAQALAPFLESGAILHRRERVVRVEPVAGGWRIGTEGGATSMAEAVVIAIGHPPATPPAELAGLSHSERLLTDPARIEGVEAGERVLVLGAGLTALDFLAALDRRGHRGPVTLLCRSGRLPEHQPAVSQPPFGDFLSPPALSARALLADVRRAIAGAAAAGISWHGVFDVLRRQGQEIWAALPAAEKARFLRHLRRRYEVSRFRMPPQDEALLRRLEEDGRLERLAGRVESAEEHGGRLELALRMRHGGRLLHQAFDRIALATGPDQRRHFSTQAWLADLAVAGLVREAPHGLGIACDRQSRVVGADGTARDDLFVVGPPTRATFGEITGAPEIAAGAEAVACRLHAALSAARVS